MRYLLRLLFVCALGVLPASGCSETASDPCRPPLDDYCKGSDCPTWEQAIAAAEEFVQQVDCYGGFGCYSEAGRCGDFRYVLTGCNIATHNWEYFDTTGTLVAAVWCSDGCGDPCPSGCCVYYGFDPGCELEQEQDFCAQLP